MNELILSLFHSTLTASRRKLFVLRIICMCFIVVLFAHPTRATTIIEDVFSPSSSNVIFSDIGSGFVEVSFGGVFDFSPIGGGAEAYSGIFSYDTSVPPFLTIPDPNQDIAFYALDFINFNIFGNTVVPINVTVLIQDGVSAGIFGDFFTLDLDLDFSNGPGISIPNTSEGLVSIGLNAGAFPGTMFSSADFPTDLDIFAASGPNPPTQFAALGSSAPIPEPSTLLLLFTGLAGLAAWRRKAS